MESADFLAFAPKIVCADIRARLPDGGLALERQARFADAGSPSGSVRFPAPQGTRRCPKPAPGGMVEGRQFAIAKPKGDFGKGNRAIAEKLAGGVGAHRIHFPAEGSSLIRKLPLQATNRHAKTGRHIVLGCDRTGHMHADMMTDAACKTVQSGHMIKSSFGSVFQRLENRKRDVFANRIETRAIKGHRSVGLIELNGRTKHAMDRRKIGRRGKVKLRRNRQHDRPENMFGNERHIGQCPERAELCGTGEFRVAPDMRMHHRQGDRV